MDDKDLNFGAVSIDNETLKKDLNFGAVSIDNETLKS
ncbi:hypothetical protein LCGC14_0467830 [marine sediment metagenome]|uniref:Uncharacterized protein n=1 Tax=marine sediment metagenome TaxID=412755 RepID=A0A0F9UZW4_9ZZZZ